MCLWHVRHCKLVMPLPEKNVLSYLCNVIHVAIVKNCFYVHVKAAVLQNILKIISYKYFKILLQIYLIVVRNKKKPTYFHFFALKTDNSLFCQWDIPTTCIHNGFCVSNAVDYATKNDVLPTILSTEFVVSNNGFIHRTWLDQYLLLMFFIFSFFYFLSIWRTAALRIYFHWIRKYLNVSLSYLFDYDKI